MYKNYLKFFSTLCIIM